ncbi:MAG TPA: hypothetical protein VFF40_04970 [Acidimicrobiia bacterium]|nr:hypothetical protein [Acidimicrobiia bacterium]
MPDISSRAGAGDEGGFEVTSVRVRIRPGGVHGLAADGITLRVEPETCDRAR